MTKSEQSEDNTYYFGYVSWNGVIQPIVWSGLINIDNVLQKRVLKKGEHWLPVDILKETYPYKSLDGW